MTCLVILSGVFSGCATQQPATPSLQQSAEKTHRYESYRHRPAYNRPYRVKGKTYYPMASAMGYQEVGTASWYGEESGNRTAMGSRFKPQGLTAAHKTLPLPSKVRVTNLRNGRSVVVLVNDRGPFKKGRLIDLSHGAARKIGLRGVTKVKVEYVGNQLSSLD
ncbi:MAG: septal ring lytic transglycosylase RlpA family protein [Gammaproteobacteria bacterium]